MSAAARACWLAAAVCLAVVAADQVTKALVEANLVVGEERELFGPFELTLVHNTGIAFGLGGGSGAPLVVLPLIALAAVGFVFARDPAKPGMWMAIGLIGGGAIGNLIDRIGAGAVTDFVELPNWPAFNLADAAITCGVLCLLVVLLREGDGKRASA